MCGIVAYTGQAPATPFLMDGLRRLEYRGYDSAGIAVISSEGQLALYRAVLRKIYPTRTVRAALIWTETPDLMELSQDVLDDAFAHVTSA